ncbi:MAG: hypothetical protein AAF570_15685 [Bacteroidota bacterium]
MHDFLSRYGGIFIGSLYGLFMRVIWGMEKGIEPAGMEGLASWSFFFVVPVLLGIIPMFFASDKQLTSPWYRVKAPIITVLLFFVYAMTLRLEDVVCGLIMGLPFLLIAALVGLGAGWMIRDIKRKKGTLVLCMVAPFVVSPLESLIPSPESDFRVENAVLIDALAEKIWENVIRVPEIADEEFEGGFFQWAGVPRPIRAELDRDTLGGRRTGYFEGGLRFDEVVTKWEKHRQVTFSVAIPKSGIRDRVFDDHILGRDYFAFRDAGYTLVPQEDGKVLLKLHSAYRLRTKMNWYGAFWANWMLGDFQDRLLNVIRNRCEVR